MYVMHVCIYAFIYACMCMYVCNVSMCCMTYVAYVMYCVYCMFVFNEYDIRFVCMYVCMSVCMWCVSVYDLFMYVCMNVM